MTAVQTVFVAFVTLASIGSVGVVWSLRDTHGASPPARAPFPTTGERAPRKPRGLTAAPEHLPTVRQKAPLRATPPRPPSTRPARPTTTKPQVADPEHEAPPPNHRLPPGDLSTQSQAAPDAGSPRAPEASQPELREQLEAAFESARQSCTSNPSSCTELHDLLDQAERVVGNEERTRALMQELKSAYQVGLEADPDALQEALRKLEAQP